MTGDVPLPGLPTLDLLEPHPTWRERRRALRYLATGDRPVPGPCCPQGLHTGWRWHFFAHDCQGCGCPADGHSLLLLGHPCLDCHSCPAYVALVRPNPSRGGG